MSILDELRAAFGIPAPQPAPPTPPEPPPAPAPAPGAAPSPGADITQPPPAPAPPQTISAKDIMALLSDEDKVEMARMLQQAAPPPLNQSPFAPPMYQPQQQPAPPNTGELTDEDVEAWINLPRSERIDGWDKFKERIVRSKVTGDLVNTGTVHFKRTE